VNNPARVMFRWKQIAGGLCLFAYLCGGAKILPGLIALGASLEGSHTVWTSSSDSGCEVVLHHETRPDGTLAVHHHGPVAKVFCLLAASSSFDPDHVLQMSVKPGTAASAADDNLFLTARAALRLAQDDPPAVFTVERHPPPLECGHLAALRATVLLI
jgi:hypothetical protein